MDQHRIVPEIVNHRSDCRYKVEYCDMLIHHMAHGLSLEAFGGKIRVSRQTLYNWMRNFEEFKEAKAIGDACLQLYFETLSNEAMRGEVESFNATVWIFKMKNLCGWKDKFDLAIEKKPVKKVICSNMNTSNITTAPRLEGVLDE